MTPVEKALRFGASTLPAVPVVGVVGAGDAIRRSLAPVGPLKLSGLPDCARVGWVGIGLRRGNGRGGESDPGSADTSVRERRRGPNFHQMKLVQFLFSGHLVKSPHQAHGIPT